MLANRPEMCLKCTVKILMKIVIATRNRKKVEEFKRILEGTGITILNLDDFPDCPEVDEDSDTFEGNAIKKAVAVSRYTGMAAVSDDSGLEVYELGGAPGVKSARYAGDGSSDRANVDKLLGDMRGLPGADRGGRFVCALALAFPGGEVETFEGIVEGHVAEEPVGKGGFGYDPVFRPKGFDRTFGEMNADEKDALSHRRIGLDRMIRYLKSRAA
jgi:XTP/dITP diphosphohydrolase